MKRRLVCRSVRVVLIGLTALCLSCEVLIAAAWDPAAADYAGRKGTTLYVSKQGDNSDGSSWQKAFHTIQAALLAVPDDQGGHRIIVRPDTYVEANLWTNHKGAEGSYNLLIGDVDGTLGSGARGRIVIDSGDPDKGFKSFDWWSTIRATTKGWSPQHTGPDVLQHRLGPVDHPQPVRHRRRRRPVLGPDRQERPGLHGGRWRTASASDGRSAADSATRWSARKSPSSSAAAS